MEADLLSPMRIAGFAAWAAPDQVELELCFPVQLWEASLFAVFGGTQSDDKKGKCSVWWLWDDLSTLEFSVP